MRRTFKRIGIGLLTTAVVVIGIPTGKVSAMAETEPVVQEALDSDQKDPSCGGSDGATDENTETAASDKGDGTGADGNESGVDGNESEADGNENEADGSGADESEAGKDASDGTDAGETDGAGEDGSETDKIGADKDESGAGMGSISGTDSSTGGSGTEKDDSDDTDAGEAETDDEEEEPEDTAELLDAGGELAEDGTGVNLLSLKEPEINDEGAYVYEAENYYEREEGIQTDGDVTFCDMQPGEVIIIPVEDSLEKGNYQLTIRSNGNRTRYEIYVNDIYAGTVEREGSGWDAADLTDDSLDGLLMLKPGDEIKISAPADFGKVDFITLTAVEGQAFEEQDAASGIIISAKPDTVPAESVLLVEAPDEAELEEICQNNGIDRAKGAFFNIRLIDGAGGTVELADDEVPDGSYRSPVQLFYCSWPVQVGGGNGAHGIGKRNQQAVHGFQNLLGGSYGSA